ncbi:MAG: metal-dependent hydrolase [Gemmatimonadaceae bacterium]
MDNVTHALAGALLAAATCEFVTRRHGEPSSTFRRAAFAIGVVMAELPDGDLAYSGAVVGMGNLGYLLHHRGHTHTVLFVIVSAVIVWGLALALRRELRAPAWAQALLTLSIVASASHLLLDYTNSYGVHPWWPIDKRWFYGDAVFIVEPWGWILALPPLLFIARGVVTRALCAILLLVIVMVAWRVDLVGTGMAAVLTTGALLWTGIVRAVPASRRVTTGIVAWLAMEGIFFTTSGIGRRIVRREVGESYRDVALSPAPGNPLCLSAVVVTEERGIYRTASAAIAPLPALRSATACRGANGEMQERSDDPGQDTPAIHWGASWSAPIGKLRALASSSCEVAAALRFMRVPGWQRKADGSIVLYDQRFGSGTNGFAHIVAHPGAPCPHPIPDWEWPRSDLLGKAP